MQFLLFVLEKTCVTSFHAHREREDTALVLALRVNRDLTAVHRDQILADHQTHSDAFVVHLRRSLQLAKQLE